jgi:hypothetical protein
LGQWECILTSTDQYSTTKVVTRKRKRKTKKKSSFFVGFVWGESTDDDHCEARKENSMPTTTLRVPSVFKVQMS